MNRAVLAFVGGLLLSGVVHADDVVFAAARLRLVNGKYYPLESSHLFRVRTDGSKLKQITFGREMDTDPCVSADGRRLLFWRRDANDLVGNVRLFSAALDGRDQKVLFTFDDVDLSRPTALARALAIGGGISIRPTAEDPKFQFGYLITLGKGPKPFVAGFPDVSPGGKYLRCVTEDVSPVGVDLKTSKRFSAAEGIWVDDRTVLSGSLEAGVSFFTLSTVSGRVIAKHRIFNVVKGKPVNCSVVVEWSRQQDDDGQKAYRLESRGKNILLQETWRSDAGGIPVIYCFGANTGRLRFELADLFLEGVDSEKAHFLTTTWKWGRGFGCEGTAPLRKLVIWDAKSVIPRQLGFDLASCHGACFVPTAVTR